MADALTVLPLNYVKKEVLAIDLDDTWRDADITRCIKTAVSWVERYTDYALYERDITINAVGCKTEIATYPITVTGVVDKNNVPIVDYVTRNGYLSIILFVPDQSIISATVGDYGSEEIPEQLLSAAEKLIVYLFENKDAYSTTLPIDIQLLINEKRRSPTI